MIESGERPVKEQAALRRVATLVASGAEPREVFQAVTREVGQLVGAQSSGMVRYEPSGETATVVGRWDGSHPQGYEIGSIVPLVGDTPVVRVLRTGEPARIDAYEGVPGPVAEQMRRAVFVAVRYARASHVTISVRRRIRSPSSRSRTTAPAVRSSPTAPDCEGSATVWRALDGSLELESPPGRGTRVRAEIGH